MVFRNVPRLLVACALAVGMASLANPTRAQSAPAPLEEAAIERGADIFYVRTLEKAAKAKTLDVDHDQLAAVRHAGALLIERAGKAKPESSAWGWSFHLVTRDEPLAWCLPGGKVLVSTGLLGRYAPTPPELAGLLAHAMAHALSGETAGEVKREFVRRADAVSPDPNRTALLVAELLPAVLAMPHDAASERTADALGLEMTASAAIDPRPTLDAWRKLGATSGASPLEFAALHPVSPERLAEMEARMPAMVTAYQTALRELPPPQAPAPAKQKRPPRKRAN